MSLPFNMTCKSCDRHIIYPIAPLVLEFACPECVEKVAKSKQITLDSETSWGRVIAEIKGR
jgi:predicted RNA-binding Zn-ribbon protein involved in translation (DUF1610 family)